MSAPAAIDRPALLEAFRRALRECQELYRQSAQEIIEHHPHLVRSSQEAFLEQMVDLSRGLLAKTVLTLVKADFHCGPTEWELVGELVAELWDKRLDAEQLRAAAQQLSASADKLFWGSLVRPFEQFPPLRDRVPRLETLVLRIGNLVAKADGVVQPAEADQLRGIQSEMRRHLVRIPVDSGDAAERGANAIRHIEREADNVREQVQLSPKPTPPAVAKPKAEQLQEALADLESLIGLGNIKRDVRELTRFLQMQQERQRMGLPLSSVSLHMVFRGNPGTGKTTVARIVGRIFGALGILAKGHLVETDRSGLVAQYAGQTGPKTNKRIDEALDGVLFIDEAYSLVAERGEDPYGAEAVAALLKRMEDDRKRLVVIIAGYPEPMDRLLRSNPGLSSRFNRNLDFPDYTAVELGQILQGMCEKDHYALPAEVRIRLLAGFRRLLDERDEHFGNGRLVRNTFENAIRRLANRIAGVAPLTRELLTVIEPDDIQLDGIAATDWEGLTAALSRIQIVCPGCQQGRRLSGKHLGKQVQCKHCNQKFRADWGEPTLP